MVKHIVETYLEDFKPLIVGTDTWSDDHLLWFHEWLMSDDASFRSISRDVGVSKSTVTSRIKKLLPLFRAYIHAHVDIFELENDSVYEKLVEYMSDEEHDRLTERFFVDFNDGDPVDVWPDEEPETSLDESDGFDQYEMDTVTVKADTSTVKTDTAYTGVVSENSLMIITSDGRQLTVNRENTEFHTVKDMLIERADFSEIEERIDMGKKVVRRLEGVQYKNGRLYYDDIEISATMIPRIMQSDLIESTGYTEALKNFFSRLVENPYREVVDQLYRFLMANSLPITDDGHFLTYKKVRDDYTDVHSGKFDNSVGTVVKIKRIQVTRDPNVTCAPGLHVCSKEYLGSFGGNLVMVCKVDPADVVSVPTDYNNSKMRVCGYEVIGEIGDGWEHEHMETYYHGDNDNNVK